MFCGSCIHDNTLVSALLAQGHDALLVPTYTPIRTDEEDVSQRRVFFGGINVYLQQKLSLFRHTPWVFDRAYRPSVSRTSKPASAYQANRSVDSCAAAASASGVHDGDASVMRWVSERRSGGRSRPWTAAPRSG